MTSKTTTDDGTADRNPDWIRRFPFDEPYPDQKEAIPKLIDNGEKGGFTAIEAACGTGKTLMSLSAGIELVRDPTSKYERVVALTPVKQQLRAFEDDIESINKNLPEDEDPVDALTIVGKADMCSYVETDRIERDEIYGACDSLRNSVKNTISSAGDEKEKIGRLQGMVDTLKSDGESGDQPLMTDEWVSPYSDQTPNYRGDDDSDAPNFCAFYANYRLKQLKDEPLIDLNGMMRGEDVLRQASERGICPHAAMMDSLDDAEVVIGNYNHAFDPLTVDAMTGGIIDEDTFLVIDEAHMLVPRVRDLLSDGVSHRTLQFALNEIDNQILEQSDNTIQGELKRAFAEQGINMSDVKRFRKFILEVKQKLEDLAIDALESENQNWQDEVLDMMDSDEEIEYPLRPPTKGTLDELTEWVINHDDDMMRDVMENAALIGSSIAEAFNTVEEEVPSFTVLETYSDSVGRVMTNWLMNDNTQFFREVVLKPRNREKEDADLFWQRYFSPRLEMLNCIPSEPIAHRLDQFGGGILMSATLEPLDVYREVSGLDRLGDDRPLQELVYGLSFPEENRESMAVNSTKFTSSNRGSQYEMNDVREEYADLMKTVVKETDGNVLIGMPSYSEAQWAEYILSRDRSINKEVRKDESSTHKQTEELKQWFFRGEGKVLTTSVRGTLTEGVDYAGDKLDAALVIGVPIRGLGGPYPDAIKTAYEDAFPGNGFDYAFNVPAVRKTRQALGRVIRGTDDVGVRVMADERYATSGWSSVRNYFPKYEQDDYDPVGPKRVRSRIREFWQKHGR